jgi:hypothetical protein
MIALTLNLIGDLCVYTLFYLYSPYEPINRSDDEVEKVLDEFIQN